MRKRLYRIAAVMIVVVALVAAITLGLIIGENMVKRAPDTPPPATSGNNPYSD